MKKAIQPIVRKVYSGHLQQNPSTQQNRDQMQINAVRKINSLLQSGTVSVTQSSNTGGTRVVKKQYGGNAGTGGTGSGVQITNQIITAAPYKRCWVCDELVLGSTAHLVVDTATTTTQTKLQTKIAHILGEGFMVYIGQDDLICRRCYNILNLMDKAESEVERFKSQINVFLNKKYNISDDVEPMAVTQQPIKMQRLTSGPSRVIHQQQQQHVNTNDHGIGMRKVSAGLQNNSFEREVPSPKPRQPVKLYKCMSCDYKSTDLTSFDPHYQECKGLAANKTQSIMQPSSITKKITSPQVHSCTMCQYKVADKNTLDEHMKKHYKMRPFKCRICTQRFETREHAQIHAKSHQPDYFKCGMCSATFNRRELLMKHLETHEKGKNQQIRMVSSVHPVASTQKLLQETIDEALRIDQAAEAIDTKNIKFHSCDHCSVTFLNESLYLQHMKTHKNVPGASSSKTNNGSYSQEEQSKFEGGAADDLESIFEKMHSEKAGGGAGGDQNAAEKLLITSQENATGEITFNITIPPTGTDDHHQQQQRVTDPESQHASIDMPTLDVGEDKDGHDGGSKDSADANADHKQTPPASVPVSMPSLDDDQETQQSHQSNTEAVPMELDEIQGGGDGQQVKFILNENGQLLSLDNHILTTDMDGNQILVQGTDMEQLQALLQSGGIVMQGEEGMAEGQTLQMLGDGSNQQMVIIQGPDGQEAHMCIPDGSLIDADGNIVIQQQGGEFNAEGGHITTEDGIQIPVSFADSDGGHITVTEGSEQHLQLLQQAEAGQTLLLSDGQVLTTTTAADADDQGAGTDEHDMKKELSADDDSGAAVNQQDADEQTQGGESDGNFLNFDELIQPQIIQKVKGS